MTATITNLATWSLRNRIRRAYGKVKREPEERNMMRELIRADAERSIQELEREQDVECDEPEQLYVGPSGEWSVCGGCLIELSPAATVARDLQTGVTYCVKCFHQHGG